MGLFSFVWNSGKSVVKFVQRHKKKVILTGVLAATYYFIARYSKSQQTDDEKANDELEKLRKKQHFNSNKKTCKNTYANILTTLKERLMKEIDTEKLTAELREQPLDKMNIWERLKVQSFARAVCCVYSSSLLYSMCSVVINVIGGYMYVEKFLVSDKNVSPVIQQKYLQSLEFVIGQGLAELAAVVEAAADKVISGVSLKEKLKLTDIENILAQIRHYVEVRKNGENETTRCLLQFLLPIEEEREDQGNCDSIIEHSAQHSIHIEQKLLLETRDILDSSDFHSVLAACLNRGFAFLLDNVVDFLPHAPNNGSRFQNLQESEIAMAKLIPIMNGIINRVMVERLYEEFAADDLISTFEANVYECFSTVQNG